MLRRSPLLRLREWDGDFVLYQEDLGETRVLSGFSADIFRLLADGPMPEDAVVTALADATEAEDIRSIVAFLVEIGVVRRERGRDAA